MVFFSAVCSGGVFPLFCGKGRKIKTVITPKSFAETDVSFEQAHVCGPTSSNCFEPQKVIQGTTTLHTVFWSPIDQNFLLHWLVTDVAGTIVFYEADTVSTNSGFNTFEVDVMFSPSDYTFTAIAQGLTQQVSQAGAAVSDLYKFSVIP